MDDRDPMGIVNYCKYVMGIHDFQLTEKWLAMLGCSKTKIEGVQRHMRKRHLLDILFS